MVGERIKQKIYSNLIWRVVVCYGNIAVTITQTLVWAPGGGHNPLMGVGLSTHTDLAKAHTKRRSKATILFKRLHPGR